MKFKSIKVKLFVFYGMLFLIISGGLGITSYVLATNALTKNVEESLYEIAEEDAKTIRLQLEVQYAALETLAASNWIKSNDMTIEQKLEYLDRLY